MKKLITLILILVLAAGAAAAELSESEQKFAGPWTMYAVGSKGTVYMFTTVFLDTGDVVQRSMVFEDGTLTKDNKASGIWGSITHDAIIFSLAGTDMTAMIKDDGYLYMYYYKDKQLCGIFSRVEDMTGILGW